MESTRPWAPHVLSSERLIPSQLQSPLHFFEDSAFSLQSRFLPSVFWSGELSYSVTKERRKFPEFGDAALHFYRSPNKATRLTKQDVVLLKTK